jgi:hypothetical protein
MFEMTLRFEEILDFVMLHNIFFSAFIMLWLDILTDNAAVTIFRQISNSKILLIVVVFSWRHTLTN